MPKSPRDRSTSSFDSSVWDPGEGKDHVFSPSIPSMPHKTGPSSWQIPAGTRWRIWSATEAPDSLVLVAPSAGVWKQQCWWTQHDIIGNDPEFPCTGHNDNAYSDVSSRFNYLVT